MRQEKGTMSKAVVLLSGGLDSATVLAIAQSQGFGVHALSFRYGQRHHAELSCAQRIAEAGAVVRHMILDIDSRILAGSALTGDQAVLKDRSMSAMGEGIPTTYVPARNTLFLSFALSYAESIGAADIFIGVNALDYSGYPDCRPRYITAFEDMANMATKAGIEGQARIRIHAPLIAMTKAEIITVGCGLGADYAMTLSCYDPDIEGRACGHCDACLLRHKGFAQAGLVDPAGSIIS